jgi:Uma2 family endonuclease
MTTAVLEKPKSSLSLQTWQNATWEDYLKICQDYDQEEIRIVFDQDLLWIDMGNEGINHSRYCDLFTLIFGFWFAKHPDQIFDSLSGCVIEKPNRKSAAPDKVLYIGGNSPQWQPGEMRRINLDQWRIPDLVAEIADTTLAIDLDEKKQLYASLGIPEYWVIDLRGNRVIAFILQSNGKYQTVKQSQALTGLSISLLEETLTQLSEGNNGAAALWFSQQLG